jgi:hypothetical protein
MMAYADGLTPEECFDDQVRPELEDLGFRLEIADLFDDAEERGLADVDVANLAADSLYELAPDELF